MDTNYVSAFVHGVFVGVVIYFIVGRMNKAYGTIKQRNKSLDTFPDAARPKLTPSGIVWKSTVAMIVWFIWLAALIVFIAITLWSLKGVLTV
jgi:hypothetical protein